MYFLGDKRGWKGQAALWTFFSRGAIHIHSPGDEEWKRVRELMEQYKDTPMDFADASLVALAEETRIKRISLSIEIFAFTVSMGKNLSTLSHPMCSTS
jgi:uncharacterized protein